MHVEEKGTGSYVIHLDGELGHHEALAAMNNISAMIEQSHPHDLMLDLGSVGFMDSSGIAVVVQASRKLASDGGGFCVCGASKQAMRVFNAAGIPKIVKFI